MNANKTIRRFIYRWHLRPAAGCPLPAPGFTLIELMVVIAIIILIAATALPTMVGLFTSGQDQQAFNILSAQLSAARALAITKGTYAGVHVQMSNHRDSQGKCYTAVVWDDPYTPGHTFDLAPGYHPQPLPGSMAVGQISSYTVSTGSYSIPDNPTELLQFTTFTVLFSPTGEIVTCCPPTYQSSYGNKLQGVIVFSSSSSLFMDIRMFIEGGKPLTLSDNHLWVSPTYAFNAAYFHYLGNDNPRAMTMFDYKILKAKIDSNNNDDSPLDYLDENGQFLALNIYTGKFFTRE